MTKPAVAQDETPEPVSTLRERRDAARHASFVGRDAEQQLFAGALRAGRLPFHVVHVWGPGGVGKTSLLGEIRRLCAETSVPVVAIDGRDVDPVPAAVTEQLLPALGGGRVVLLIDTYEALRSLDGWFQRTFVPDLPADALVVFAGRDRPAPEWEVGWGEEVRVVALQNLKPSDAEAFLGDHGVPDAAWADVLAFTRGHPLALALVAERFRQRPDSAPPTFDPADEPGVVRALLDRFVAAVPTPAHRAAIEGASIVRAVSEPLLADLVGDREQAHELFAWLRQLAFVEAGPRGLRLHDLVRETVEADLRWRDGDRHAAFHKRARRHYTNRLRREAPDAVRRETLADYVHLYRDNPIVRPLMGRLRDAWAEARVHGPTPLREGDADVVARLVARHEGEAAADVARWWLRHRPEAFETFRGEQDEVQGFLLTLRLGQTGAADREADPALARAWDAVGTGLRAGEVGLFFRSWLDAEAHQGISAVQSLIFARTVQRYLSTPGLAVSLLAVADPGLWAPVFGFAGLHRYPEVTFEVGGHPYAAFGRDWRASPPDQWLEGLAGQAPDVVPAPPEAPEPSAVVALDRETFADAVREALKAYARPYRLKDSPLLQSRVVVGRGGDPVEALQGALEDASAELESGPRDAPYSRALRATYLDPAPTQAAAAEQLGLPFSTYRRHLGRGVDHVVASLWRRERGG